MHPSTVFDNAMVSLDDGCFLSCYLPGMFFESQGSHRIWSLATMSDIPHMKLSILPRSDVEDNLGRGSRRRPGNRFPRGCEAPPRWPAGTHERASEKEEREREREREKADSCWCVSKLGTLGFLLVSFSTNPKKTTFNEGPTRFGMFAKVYVMYVSKRS